MKTTTNRYRYNSKEQLTEVEAIDYGARQYSTELCRWLQVDPLAEKYKSLSSYNFCANNPLKFVDVDGREVKPTSVAELVMIQNTLPKEARKYVALDNKGLIDKGLINSHTSVSQNYNNLKSLVNSNRVVEVVLDDKFKYIGKDGVCGTETMQHSYFDPQWDTEDDKDIYGQTMAGTSTGESGFLGKTLFPDNEGLQNSISNNIVVIVNKNLSAKAAAEIYSHEANGHALLYILNGGDHNGASHQTQKCGLTELNVRLKEMILQSKQETIFNMQEK
ncbi:MAG: hypothetical protein MJ069_04350 [Salinivirgaceae bacterium]|nr:hypothetical protein [Salinivirgaceae bacterium]